MLVKKDCVIYDYTLPEVSVRLLYLSGLQNTSGAQTLRPSIIMTCCLQRVAFGTPYRQWLTSVRLLTAVPRRALYQTPNKYQVGLLRTGCAAGSLSGLAEGSTVKQVRP